MENPKIRFKGFTKDWEQRKLIDYLEVSSEKNRDNRFTKEDVLSVSGEYGIVNQIEFQGRSFAGASVSNYGVVENGDVVYTKSPLKSNPYGIIKTNKGIPGIVSTLYAVYKPKEITDSKFVQIYFELDSRMNSYMHPLVNKGAKNDMKVSAENALKGMVSFPKKDEQEMISLYFSTIDHLITLHQRKCEQTKKLKKYMLQKMFPQNGAKVPEIRFDGFTYDWEQRKVSEITKFHKQGFYTTEEYDNSKKYYLLRGTDLTENKLVLKDTPKIDATEKDYDAFKTEIGDFLIVRSGTVGTYGIVDVDIPAIFGSYLIDFRFDMEQVTNEFFGYFYQSSLFKSQLNKIIQASANTNINAENIKSTVISLPSLNEQRRISEYLGNLDNLITLHQRKCDELKKMKKYMLQNMFI